jgi:hypothetical protein
VTRSLNFEEPLMPCRMATWQQAGYEALAGADKYRGASSGRTHIEAVYLSVAFGIEVD